MRLRLDFSEPPDDPWRGRQPRYEKLVMTAPNRFEIIVRLSSGERVASPLGRPSIRVRPAK